MSRLNIPLSTNQSTRPGFFKGRVLWMLIGWLTIVLTAFVLANLWFTRDTLSAFAPKGTTAVIHLTLSKQAWTKFLSDFDDLPLISARPLTVKDIAALKPKEISIFILQNNETAVAIRASEHNLQQETLNSYGINIQKLGRNRWLLSDQPLPYITKGKTKWSLGSIWPGVIGTLQLDGFFGHISINKNGYSVDLPKTKQTNGYLPALPDTAVAAASFQPGAGIDLSAVFDRFNALLSPLETVQGEVIAQKMEENGGIIVLTNNGFLIETTIESSVLSQILQTAAAFQNPTTKAMPMPDGSLVQEITIDPNKTEFNSIWINGQEVKSINVKNGQFFALDGQKTDIIASNQTLLEEYLNKKQGKTSGTCGGKTILVFLKPNEIENGLLDDGGFVEPPILLKTTLKFTEISLNKDKINLCY